MSSSPAPAFDVAVAALGRGRARLTIARGSATKLEGLSVVLQTPAEAELVIDRLAAWRAQQEPAGGRWSSGWDRWRKRNRARTVKDPSK